MKMRYLNKIVFINSAAIRYSEVQLDGNIHLIGTQGVGKSTILRAILFFYNADTQKLGIPVEKKSYQDYYFPYADSSIIYEVARDDSWFTVFSYKTMNRICYRFISSPYRPDLFIDENGAPYSSDRIRSVLDKNGVKYSGAISTYEEYRNILYGNSDNKRDYSCYSLMEGGAYQNMIRTIQNVLLNSRLEADYIKQTIISSLNEENSAIDLSRYRSHLSGFESQLNDISVFRDPKMRRKADSIVSLSDDIRRRDLRVNDLCRQLRGAYLATESILPKLTHDIHELEVSRADCFRRRDGLDAESKGKTAKMDGELAVLNNALSEAESKRKFYVEKNIDSLIERCDKLEILRKERDSLEIEKNILSSKNKEASVLHANLLANLKNELAGFENECQKQLLQIEADINVRREDRRAYYRDLREDVRRVASKDTERWQQEREKSTAEIAEIKMRIKALRGQVLSSDELEALKVRVARYDMERKSLELKIRELKYELNFQTKEMENAERHLDDDFMKLSDSNGVKLDALAAKIEELSEFLDNQKDSFFNWLSENKPGWEQTIGQVCDERLLYGKKFEAELDEGDSFYGIRFVPAVHRNVKTKDDYLAERQDAEKKRDDIQRFLATASQDLEQAKENLRKQYQATVKPIKDDIYHVEYELEQLEIRKKEDESRLVVLREEVSRLHQDEIGRVEEELVRSEADLSLKQTEIEAVKSRLIEELQEIDIREKDELERFDKERNEAVEATKAELAHKKAELDERKAGYDREQFESLIASGGDPKRLEDIQARLAYIEQEIRFINEAKALVIEYLKDKREILDRVSDWQSESERLKRIIAQEQELLRKNLQEVNQEIAKIDIALKDLKEQNRKALENRDEYHRSTLLDWFKSREAIFASMNRIEACGDCRSLVREITICISEQSRKFSDLRGEIIAYVGNFSEENMFAFKTTFTSDQEYLDFANDLKDFIDEDKITEYQSRVNTRNSDIFRQITVDTKSMMSQEGNIRSVVERINANFKEKNFVGIIQCIEMRIDSSQNKIVNLLKEIRRFNEEYSWDLEDNLFASAGDDSTIREKAIVLLRELIKSMESYSGNLIRLSDFFDLKFRVVENKNDTGFVERLTNVGSEGTDILVKSMVNIMLLDVFKRNASVAFSDFKLHCMMDEIGKLHPNNVAGILKFANDRDIFLINGSPTEQDALSYKHIYKLEKDHDSFTRVRRVITQFD